MKAEKHGNNWSAYYDAESGRYFARIMYINREGLEEYRYEITQDIYGRLGTFSDDVENERLIRNGEIAYTFENTMYGTLGPERRVWNDEANGAMKEVVKKQESIKKKKKK